MATKRDLRLDNLKCLLMFLVVLCHLMVEFVDPYGPLTKGLYQTIYVFHMPVFAFTTGYFARFRPHKIVAGLVLPYVVFQVLATARRNLVAGRALWTGLTLFYPQWTLWYLLACILWYCTIPALEQVRTLRTQGLVVGISFMTSLAAGCVPCLRDFLDLSRVVVLFPFFCAGYFAGRMHLSQRVAALPADKLLRLRRCLSAALLVFLAAQTLFGDIPKQILYRDVPYGSLYEFYGRTLIQCGAVLWCALLFVSVSTRDLGVFSAVGRNTMSVYLLHPWVIRLLRHAPALPQGEAVQVLACALLSVAMLVALGNDVVGRAFAYVFGGGWVATKREG